MPKKPKRASDQFHEDENRRLYADHLLPRYCRVVQLLPGDAIEIACRPGHRLTIVHQVEGDKRSMRIVLGPIVPKRGK
jgi:hypothetical protein